MSQYAKNDKLFIQAFLISLIGSATTWFVKLDKTEITSQEDLTIFLLTATTWFVQLDTTEMTSQEDLVNASFTHYKFNSEILSDQFDLQKKHKAR